jgi:hypothetical protein
MKNTPKQQIEELATLDVAALQKRHAAFFGKETTCAHRQFLFRKLAWHVQAKAEGGLPTSMLELAKSIARDTPLRTRVLTNADRRRAGIPMENSSTTTIEPAHDARTPLPGGLIVKQYRGRTHVVTVLDNGFQYEGCHFSSLSAIAMAITGTKWNGYLFFGCAKEKTNGRK